MVFSGSEHGEPAISLRETKADGPGYNEHPEPSVQHIHLPRGSPIIQAELSYS